MPPKFSIWAWKLGAELMLAIAKEVDSGRLPPRAGAGMEELYSNYRDAVYLRPLVFNP